MIFVSACLLISSGLSAAAGSAGSAELRQTMTQASQKMASMSMSGDVDHDFVMSMKMHREEAVKMAKIALREAADPKAKDFARRIISAQEKEIAEFDRWLSQHPEPGMKDKKEMHGMGGE